MPTHKLFVVFGLHQCTHNCEPLTLSTEFWFPAVKLLFKELLLRGLKGELAGDDSDSLLVHGESKAPEFRCCCCCCNLLFFLDILNKANLGGPFSAINRIWKIVVVLTPSHFHKNIKYTLSLCQVTQLFTVTVRSLHTHQLFTDAGWGGGGKA